jgi:alanyl-tRNA synthetase
LKNKLAKDALGDVMNQIVDVKGVKLLAAKVLDVDMNGLRNLSDQIKDKMGDGVIILASSMGTDKVNLIATATDAAMSKGAHAGNLIKELAVLVGGGGGGRPNMAQAGGKNPAGIDAVIEQAQKALEGQVK